MNSEKKTNDPELPTTHEIRPWEVVSQEYLFRRPWLTVRRDALRLPNGRIAPEYYVLEYPTWINTIAIDPQGRFVMVRQYRHGLGEVLTELCAGVAEEGETPLQAAQRELLEETGYAGGQWQEWMVISPNPGSQNNLVHCFLAVGVEPTGSGQHLDRTEDVAVELLHPDEVLRMLRTNQMRQALMAAPLWKYFYIQATEPRYEQLGIDSCWDECEA